jgi:hypothetical protein
VFEKLLLLLTPLLTPVVALTVPSILVLSWATTWDDWWKWVVIVFAALWTVVWGIAGLTQLFKHEEEPSAGQTAADLS